MPVVGADLAKNARHDLGPVAAIALEPLRASVKQQNASVSASRVARFQAGDIGFRETIVSNTA